MSDTNDDHVDLVDDDDDVEVQPMAVLESYATKDEAIENARLLVEHGVGANVVPVPADELEDDGPQAAYRIEVLPIDVRRAERALGMVEAAPHEVYDPENPPKLEKGPVPWKTLLVVWVAAMIIVPALAFFVAYNMFNR
jgi:hypothetical protein